MATQKRKSTFFIFILYKLFRIHVTIHVVATRNHAFTITWFERGVSIFYRDDFSPFQLYYKCWMIKIGGEKSEEDIWNVIIKEFQI